MRYQKLLALLLLLGIPHCGFAKKLPTGAGVRYAAPVPKPSAGLSPAVSLTHDTVLRQ